jgi:CheY-like chemotaxis protein
VDDHAVNRQFLSTLLGYGKHKVLEARDGAEALTQVRAERPDLVIADILMPTMDGYEFVRQLREDPEIARTPVIFCSAMYQEREALTLAQACGVSHVLTKPTDPDILLNIIARLLNSTPPSAPEPVAGEFDRQHLRLVSDKLSEHVERLSGLLEVGRQLASERDPLRIPQLLAECARQMTAARYAIVTPAAEEGSFPQAAFVSGLEDEPRRKSGLLVDRELITRLLGQDRALRLRDVQLSSLPSPRSASRCFLGAPLLSPSRRYGVLCLIEKLGAGSSASGTNKSP